MTDIQTASTEAELTPAYEAQHINPVHFDAPFTDAADEDLRSKPVAYAVGAVHAGYSRLSTPLLQTLYRVLTFSGGGDNAKTIRNLRPTDAVSLVVLSLILGQREAGVASEPAEPVDATFKAFSGWPNGAEGTDEDLFSFLLEARREALAKRAQAIAEIIAEGFTGLGGDTEVIPVDANGDIIETGGASPAVDKTKLN